MSSSHVSHIDPTESARVARPQRTSGHASEDCPPAVNVMRGSSCQHVWFASIPEVFRLIDPAQALSAEELRRAQSFKMPADRDRFLAGRALLRYALTQRTGGAIPVSSWRYRHGSYGKPIMDAGMPSLEFNLSHSEMCVAVAVGNGPPLGIDIESITPEDCDEIVADVLTERELRRLDFYSRDRQRVQFVRIWTVKEACAKALGFGASIDFRGLEVELDPPQPTIRSLLNPGQEFGVAAMTIRCASRPYCLSLVTARGVPKSRPISRFWAKGLTDLLGRKNDSVAAKPHPGLLLLGRQYSAAPC